MAIYTLGNDTIVDSDYIYKATALPNNTSYTSTAFEFGTNNHRLEFVLALDAETAITDTKVLTVELLHSDTEDGTYTTHKVLYTVTGSTTTLAEGDLIRYVPETGVKQWCKVKVTTTDNLATKTITSYVTQIV